MARPIIIVNCKTYPQATGSRAVKLAKLCEAYARKHNVDIRIAVQATDVALVARAVSIPVYAQHCNDVEPGTSTGWVSAYALKQAGASGTLLNHAEHRIPTAQIKRTIATLRKNGLHAVVCAESVARLRELDPAGAALLCVEPPELIGGDVSVSVAKPGVVRDAVKAAKKPLLVGAGVKTKKDYQLALSLGAKGVLLSSGIVLAKDQGKALSGLLS